MSTKTNIKSTLTTKGGPPPAPKLVTQLNYNISTYKRAEKYITAVCFHHPILVPAMDSGEGDGFEDHILQRIFNVDCGLGQTCKKNKS